MKDLLKSIEYMMNYGIALQNAVKKYADALPIHTKQFIQNQAKKRLDSTREEYLSAVKTKFRDYVLVVEIDPDNWIANAVESGVGQFDMKQGHLASPKAKVSKLGYRYIRIPIGVKKDKKPGTEKGQEFQKKINEVLAKPKFGLQKLKMLMNGQVMESNPLMTTDPTMQGIYRTRVHDSVEAYHSGKSRPAWQYVMFRTMSENPLSKSVWNHPGIKPVHILKKAEIWLNENHETILEELIKAEIESLNNRFFGGPE